MTMTKMGWATMDYGFGWLDWAETGWLGWKSVTRTFLIEEEGYDATTSIVYMYYVFKTTTIHRPADVRLYVPLSFRCEAVSHPLIPVLTTAIVFPVQPVVSRVPEARRIIWNKVNFWKLTASVLWQSWTRAWAVSIKRGENACQAPGRGQVGEKGRRVAELILFRCTSTLDVCYG
jgi:hypothetical protein